MLIVIGVTAGWIAHLVLADREATNAKPAVTTSESKPENSPASRDRAAAADDPSRSASADVAVREEAVSGDAESATLVLAHRHTGDSEKSESNQPANTTDPAEKAREDLKHAMMIRCDFKPGATGYWANQKLNVSLFQWQGGPITFEIVDLDSGTARMLGGDGATGSQDGVIDVMVTVTSTGLHFSAFTPTRIMVVATVFVNKDASGQYRAVMSRHGSPTFYENISEQNYGSCDIGLTELRPRSN
ncbi:MAG TPA: hypothetical protein VFU13_06855 [Steroidobacteraceae bacterium]|nr:hypothetical protein [Steroidobacteraceae bacterium]